LSRTKPPACSAASRPRPSSRDTFPPLLNFITGFLPLTYLADALRHVANDNASLWAVRGDLLGLVVWGIIAGLIAVKVFSWE
jgi:ABC-type multidrug transport system permease subunit